VPVSIAECVSERGAAPLLFLPLPLAKEGGQGDGFFTTRKGEGQIGERIIISF